MGEVVRAEHLQALWKEKYSEWQKRPKTKLPKWFGERPGKKAGEPESPEDDEEGGAEAPAEGEERRGRRRRGRRRGRRGGRRGRGRRGRRRGINHSSCTLPHHPTKLDGKNSEIFSEFYSIFLSDTYISLQSKTI